MPEETSNTRRTSRLAVGVMSGTSIDGLDAALVRIDGKGLAMGASFVHGESAPLGDLGPRLRAIAEQKPVTAEEIAEVAWEFGLLHVDLIERLDAHSPSQIAVIAVHGQTVYHRPSVSWQLINAAPIATRWPESVVVSDLRQRDLALGGQGAPITPLADWVLFRDAAKSRAVVNLGGFCNVTILPVAEGSESLDSVRGFDVCACNHLLDWVARERLGVAFDEGGAAASRGTCHDPLRTALQVDQRDVRSSIRSLGTGDEAIDVLRKFTDVSPEDMLASVCEAIAENIVQVTGGVDEVLLGGGGARNKALVAAIRRYARGEVIRSDVLGVPIEMREAMAMAILGVMRADGVEITLPQVTGRRAVEHTYEHE